MNAESDAELIARAVAGDEQAFARLLERHYATIFRTAFRWCGRRDRAEDVAQEVCVKLARQLAGFDGRARFETWLYRVTINAAKDAERSARRYVSAEEVGAQTQAAPPGEHPERLLDVQRILEVVQALPAKLRDAVLLVYLEDLSHREAAAVLGCAETTVSWRIFQARRRLREAWGD